MSMWIYFTPSLSDLLGHASLLVKRIPAFFQISWKLLLLGRIDSCQNIFKNNSEQCLLPVKPKKSRRHHHLDEENSDTFITKTIICFLRSTVNFNSSKVSKPLTSTDSWRKRHFAKYFCDFKRFSRFHKESWIAKYLYFCSLTTSHDHGVTTCSDIWPHTLLYVLHAGSKQLLLE